MNISKSKNKLLIVSIIVTVLLIIVTFLVRTTSTQTNTKQANASKDFITDTATDTTTDKTPIVQKENLNQEQKKIPDNSNPAEETPANNENQKPPVNDENEKVPANDESEKPPVNDEYKKVPANDENEKAPVTEELTPSQEKVISAGYGVVVELDTNYYGVLTHGDGCVNGKKGGEILRDYLAEKGLIPQNVSGGWIDPDKDWYCWIAKNIIKGE